MVHSFEGIDGNYNFTLLYHKVKVLTVNLSEKKADQNNTNKKPGNGKNLGKKLPLKVSYSKTQKKFFKIWLGISKKFKKNKISYINND